tara:strand:- start:1133 stop:1408 length:276 start_codon:yes stop_codon:yes gene_type:complete
MKISRMNQGDWGKVKAFFDLETTDGFTIKGFKIVEGSNGLFVGFPSQKNSEGEYKDTIFADKVLRQKVNQLAVESFDSGASQETKDENIPF